jgi:hypothetical protein
MPQHRDALVLIVPAPGSSAWSVARPPAQEGIEGVEGSGIQVTPIPSPCAHHVLHAASQVTTGDLRNNR